MILLPCQANLELDTDLIIQKVSYMWCLVLRQRQMSPKSLFFPFSRWLFFESMTFWFSYFYFTNESCFLPSVSSSLEYFFLLMGGKGWTSILKKEITFSLAYLLFFSLSLSLSLCRIQGELENTAWFIQGVFLYQRTKAKAIENKWAERRMKEKKIVIGKPTNWLNMIITFLSSWKSFYYHFFCFSFLFSILKRTKKIRLHFVFSFYFFSVLLWHCKRQMQSKPEGEGKKSIERYKKSSRPRNKMKSEKKTKER